VIGVVLSGGLNDGTHGLLVIKRHGGVAMAQRAEEAMVPSMPRSAIQAVDVDYVLPAAEMGAAIARLAREPVKAAANGNGRGGQDVAEAGAAHLRHAEREGREPRFTCPGCGGALWELTDGGILRYRCHVGHGYTAESLLAQHTDGLDGALWAALRALEEGAALRRRLARRARDSRLASIASGYDDQAADLEARAASVRDALLKEVKRSPREPRKRAGRARRPMGDDVQRQIATVGRRRRATS
jgi:two-component system chemotaxis response regulator CheB